MKISKNIVISLVIILILGAYLLISNMKDTSHLPDLPEWEEGADDIIIRGPENSIHLYKKDSRWVINDEAFPADETAVKELEGKIKKLRIVDLVSEGKIYKQYDLTKDKYTEVIVRQNDRVLRYFMFGKKSRTSQHTFLRIRNETGIFMASGTFNYILNKKVKDLRNKEIIALEDGSISEFSIAYKGRTFRLQKQKLEIKGKKGTKQKKVIESWVCVGHESISLNDFRIKSFLNTFKSFKASGFDERSSKQMRNALIRVAIKSDGKDISFEIFKEGRKENETYYAVSSESPYVYSISRWDAKKFSIEHINDLKGK